MKLNYKILIILSCLLLVPAVAYSSTRGLDGYEWQKIDAKKNARTHSNMGNIYFGEKNYISALKEYEIAYNLTYDSPESATYLYNMGRCLIKLEKYEQAKRFLKGAINKDCINMTYYEAYVESCIKTYTEQKELQKALKDNTNPYNRIIAGLIYYQTGNKTAAKAIFDEFINQHPKMIITDDVRAYLKKIN